VAPRLRHCARGASRKSAMDTLVSPLCSLNHPSSLRNRVGTRYQDRSLPQGDAPWANPTPRPADPRPPAPVFWRAIAFGVVFVSAPWWFDPRVGGSRDTTHHRESPHRNRARVTKRTAQTRRETRVPKPTRGHPIAGTHSDFATLVESARQGFGEEEKGSLFLGKARRFFVITLRAAATRHPRRT
jgi:hypothetical protein